MAFIVVEGGKPPLISHIKTALRPIENASKQTHDLEQNAKTNYIWSQITIPQE